MKKLVLLCLMMFAFTAYSANHEITMNESDTKSIELKTNIEAIEFQEIGCSTYITNSVTGERRIVRAVGAGPTHEAAVANCISNLRTIATLTVAILNGNG